MVIVYRAFQLIFVPYLLLACYSPILGRKGRGCTGTSWYVVVRNETDLAK